MAQPHISRQTFLLALLAIAPMLSPAGASGVDSTKDEATKNVLLFSSYDPSLPANITINENIRTTLRKNSPVRLRFYQEYLESSRIPESKYEEALASFLGQKYEGERLDLIFALGVPALKTLLKHRADLLPGTPIVFYYYGATEEAARQLSPNVTGVMSKPEYGKTVEIVQALHPDTEKIIFVAGNSRQDRITLEEARQEFDKYAGGAELSYLTDLTIDELRQRLASLPEKSLVIFLSFFSDRAGKSFSGPEALSVLAPSSSAPVYGLSRTYLGYGIVGGSLLDFEVIGKLAGEVGLRVLSGERPEDIPVQTAPSVLMFDWREMKRWRISEESLPPGSAIEFREQSFWELYKWYVIAIIGVGVIEAMLIAGLLINRTRRRQAEEALRQSDERLRLAQRATRVGTWEWNLATGESIWSEGIYELLGLEPGDGNARVEDFVAFIHPEDRKRALDKVATATRESEVYYEEFRIIRRDGDCLWLASKGQVIRGDSGSAERIIGVNIDITERKQAEEVLKEAFAQVSELKSQLEAENIYLREEIRLEHDFNEIVGKSEAIRNVFVKIEQVAPTNTTVLILGETGTGKELVAHAIHSTSLRKDKPLIKVNCATLPTTLIESELFGHERGAFTGATTRQLGRFELASGGTIFLDEIGDLPLELQGKLLRVLQEGEFERLGSGRTIKVNARVIAATNRDLATEVQKGLFREDLWYRLNVFPITVPPLRERKEDIPLLVEAFVRKFSKELGKPVKAIAPATMRALRDYSWPGNIRELANVIERAMINTEAATLRLADQLSGDQAMELPFSRQTLEDMERQYILCVLEETGWRIEGPKGAARILGLNPSTLRTRMAKLGIQRSKNDPQ